MNQEQENQEQTKRKQRAEKTGGKGSMVYLGSDMIEVLENFQEMSDHSTMRKASDELAKLLKKYNLFLRDAAEEQRRREEREGEKKEEDEGFAGFTGI